MADDDVDVWSARIAKKLEGAQVVGRLADGPGFLVLYDGTASSGELEHIERCLVSAGVQAWHWQADGHERLKIRAYTQKRHARWAHVTLLVLFIAAVVIANHDVHSALQAAQRWLGARW